MSGLKLCILLFTASKLIKNFHKGISVCGSTLKKNKHEVPIILYGVQVFEHFW